MAKVNVSVVESGEPVGGVGGVGVPGLPGVIPSVASAMFDLTGQRIRTLPFAKTRFGNA